MTEHSKITYRTIVNQQYNFRRTLFSILVLFQIGFTQRLYIAVADDTGRNWHVANQYCLDTFGTTLATIENTVDAQSALNATLESNSPGSTFWIGLNDIENEDHWIYVDGFNCGGNCKTLTAWNDGEPNDIGGEDCGCIYGDQSARTANNMINDIGCLYEEQFDTPINLLCNSPGYELVTNPSSLNWFEANYYCKTTYGTELATIWDTSHAHKLLDMTEGQTRPWIGLNDIVNEHKWMFTGTDYDCGKYDCSDGTNYPYWIDGEPNNYDDEDCAEIESTATNINVMLNDQSCLDTSDRFFCNQKGTLSPTTFPTIQPTNIPTSSPTICYDINNQYANVRYQSDTQYILNKLAFNISIPDTKIMENNTEYAYFGKYLRLVKDEKQQVKCNQRFSCANINILFDQNSICYISCIAEWSCGFANIDLTGCQKSHVICNGKNACNSMKIQVSDSIFNHKILLVDCGISTSCHNMQLNLIGDLKSEISCIALNACDNLFIETQVGKQENHLLYLYAHSINVTFDNGYGYQNENVTQKYIECNTQNSFIQWNNTLSQEEITTTILSQFADQIFPCQGLNIKCWEGTGNNETSSNCNMKYQIKPDLLNETLLTTSNPNAACYYVSIDELMEITCQGNCVTSPTPSPTPSPTNQPTTLTINPTNAPSISPTHNPTSTPSFSPSFYPTMPPSITPTFSPTITPTVAPSFSPTPIPTANPTAVPSRAPTSDSVQLYDTTIAINYELRNLTAMNKQNIVQFQSKIVSKLERTIERGYVDKETLPYSAFWVQILEINGVNVIYNLDINNINNEATVLSSMIHSDSQIAGFIITKSKAPTFRSVTQTTLQEYFNNTNLFFNVSELNGLKPETRSSSNDESTNNTAIIVSVVIVTIGAIVSSLAFIYNKMESSKVDNAAFWMPILVALNMYDFLSDINLSINMFTKAAETQISLNNVIFYLAVASVVFIVVPFGSNLWYAMTITHEDIIQNNPSARAWFGQHMTHFICICVACAGTYPALALTSSRIFGFDFFNAGLLSSDLHELSKIKLRSTIYLENGPQLIIQILYSLIISEFESDTILAFVASSLSIIASIITYYAQKEQTKDFIVEQYFIRFHTPNDLTNTQQEKIEQRKGLKMGLGASLCSAFNISNKSIEVGFITKNKNGCSIHLQHSIFKDDLNSAKEKVFHNQNINIGYDMINITADRCIRNVFEECKHKICDALINHFDFQNGKEFAATYYKSNAILKEREHDKYNKNNIVDLMTRRMTRKHTNTAYKSIDINESKEEVDNKEGSEIEMQEMKQMQQDILIEDSRNDIKIIKQVKRLKDELTSLENMLSNKADNNTLNILKIDLQVQKSTQL
eukprot:314516_1